ncbi:MAG: phage portal protein, partial [Dehalococcoidia bacterium]
MANRVTEAIRILTGTKAISMPAPRSLPWQVFQPGGSRVDYNRLVDPMTNSIIMACINWIARTWPEAPPTVWSKDSDGTLERVEDHPLSELLKKPNPFYSGGALFMGTILSWVLDGHAYWIKERNSQNGVVELWYTPHWLIEPKGSPNDPSVFIDHYDYSPGGVPIPIAPENVVHLRYGIDPHNVRKGLSPLRSLMRELWTDEEAANYTGSILKNMGVPGLVISPKGDMAAVPSPDEVKETKAYYQQNLTGDHRGEPIVMKGPTEVNQFGFDPSQMNTRSLRQIPEERVTAILGIPAAVVGFGTGLEQTKVGATMREMREMAYEGNIIPTQRLFAEGITNQLAPDFVPDPKRVVFGFDISKVRVLQEDENKRAERYSVMVKGGWATVADARQANDLDVEETDNVYLRDLSTVEVPVGEEGQRLGDMAPEGGDDDDDATEARSFEHWPELKAKSQAQTGLVNQLRRDGNRLERVFQHDLAKAFDDLGALAAKATRGNLKGVNDDMVKLWSGYDGNGTAPDLEAKANPTPEEIESVRLIVEAMNIESWKTSVLAPSFQGHYLRTANMTLNSINTTMQLGVDMPAPVEQRILRTGGKRMGLMDIEEETKRAIFRALEEGRALGEGPPALTRRIREQVPAGRFGKAGPQYRSSMIARTETKFAQNASSLEIYKASDVVTGMLAFDNQTGFNDDDCTLRDGKTFTFPEAESEMNAEHPNGTLSFAPTTG